MKTMKYRYAVFGAGNYGLRALADYGRENISCFIDNDTSKQGKELNGIKVYSFENYRCSGFNDKILVATKNAGSVIKDLIDAEYYNYAIYSPSIGVFKSYWPENKLVVGASKGMGELYNENNWNDRQEKMIRANNETMAVFIRNWKNSPVLFRHIEIETYNRCNGVCEFCPVNIHSDTRQETYMNEEVFHKIIDELSEYHYSGRISLFSNNEPFLDDRILSFHKYARNMLPFARMHLYTNGTRLTLEIFREVISYLDEIIIDNYTTNGELISTNKAIKDYCQENPELIKKVTILMRNPKEILTSRGGDAPNRKEKQVYEWAQCILPFRQMIIRPDGKVSLCCNDPLGKNTLGDVSQESLQDIWYSNRFEAVRTSLEVGRGCWDHCNYCDTFILD